jgi:cell division protein ZapA (FtsZ GTPase activity inhibitor)
MAALNITHDMLGKSQQLNESRHQTLQKLKFLEDKIDRSLQINRQIEIT